MRPLDRFLCSPDGLPALSDFASPVVPIDSLLSLVVLDFSAFSRPVVDDSAPRRLGDAAGVDFVFSPGEASRPAPRVARGEAVAAADAVADGEALTLADAVARGDGVAVGEVAPTAPVAVVAAGEALGDEVSVAPAAAPVAVVVLPVTEVEPEPPACADTP